MKVHKAVIQIPFDEELAEDLLDLRWQESENPHGPHIKVYPDGKDAKTGEPCIFVRCKDSDVAKLRALTNRVFAALE